MKVEKKLIELTAFTLSLLLAGTAFAQTAGSKAFCSAVFDSGADHSTYEARFRELSDPHSLHYTDLYKILKEVTRPDSPAHMPGFEIPIIGKMAPFTVRCASVDAIGPIRSIQSRERTYFEYWEGGEAIGQLSIGLPAGKGTSISVDRIQVRESARGRGISRLLFQEMLNQAGPHVSEITAELAHTNIEVFTTTYYRISTPGSPDYVAGLTKAEAYAIATQATPFAKAMNKLGFTELADAEIQWTLTNGPPAINQIKVVFRLPDSE